MSTNSIHIQKFTMNKATTLTIILSFLGAFQGVLAVSSARTHESPPPNRIARQTVVPGNNLRNSANYDPYSMYVRSKRGEKESLTSNSLLAEDVSGGKQNDYYDPFFFYPSYARLGNGVRSRRNSHNQQPYLRSASNQREVAYLYDRNSNVDNNNIFANQPSNQRLYHYRNPNTFLTKQQVTGVPTRNAPVLARYYFPQSNSIDYRKPSNYYDQGRGYYRGDRGNYESSRQSAAAAPTAGAGGPEEAWSIQVGTQLKVQDDGRERNPEQFYVRDEQQRSSNYNRRYPTYYRK